MDKIYTFLVDADGQPVSKKFDLDKNVKVVHGIMMSSDRPNLLFYRGSQRIELSGEELYPEDFESKIEEQLSLKFDVCHWSESDLKSTTSSLFESTPQKDMKLLIRTKTESVDEHYLEFIAAKTLAETPPSPSLT